MIVLGDHEGRTERERKNETAWVILQQRSKEGTQARLQRHGDATMQRVCNVCGAIRRDVDLGSDPGPTGVDPGPQARYVRTIRTVPHYPSPV